MKGTCKLCLEEKELQESHSIPRSYFKRLKKNDSQLIVVQKGSKPKRGNLDPKEPLLCFDCEQFISLEYESYGTRLLRNHHNIRKNSDHIIINAFDYKRFYLFLLSILWRASISKNEHYSTVNSVPELDGLMRHCIKQKQLRISRNTLLKIDNFIRICVFRLIDSTGKLPDHVIKSILSNFAFKKDDEEFGGVVWYFIVEGFAVFYMFSAGNDHHEIIRLRLKSQLTSGSHQKIYKLDIFQNPIFSEIFHYLISSAKEIK